MNGDKSGFNDAASFLAAGISVVSINYRFIKDAEADGLVPPAKGPLHDAARALQFVRSKAAEWNIDKERRCERQFGGRVQFALARVSSRHGRCEK